MHISSYHNNFGIIHDYFLFQFPQFTNDINQKKKE